MNDQTTYINATVAELSNVKLAVHLLTRAVDRPDHLPGIVALTGFSGLGKTYAASYAANLFNAGYIQCQFTMTKKSFLTAVARELSITATDRTTVGQLMAMVCGELVATNTPLIIDEADYLIDKGCVEMVRDIFEGSAAPILLIGEENFPRYLEKYERFHNRILDWGVATECTLDDAKQLAGLYHPNMVISDDLLAHVVKSVRGGIRRVVVNLEHIWQDCLVRGTDTVTLSDWGNKPLWTGDAPKRRRIVY